MGLSSGNSVGVAISQPRVEVRSASTLGIGTKKDSNSVGVALSRRRYRSRNISGTVANITIINNKQGDTKTQKAVVTAVGFAWVCLLVTPVGKRVFLLILPIIPTVMHGMTPAAATAFCIFSLPYLILWVVAFAIGLLIFLLRQRLRLIATPLPFRDALRRAGDLRFRVARGAYRLRRILLPPFRRA